MTFLQEIINYVNNLPELSRGHQASSFWEGKIKHLKANLKIVKTEDDLWRLTKNLTEQPAVRFGVKTKPINWLTKRIKYVLHRNKIWNIGEIEAENIAALKFLKSEGAGLYDEYEKLRLELGIDSQMGIVRQFYYLKLFEKSIKDNFGNKPLVVLEIGGGANKFARMFCQKYNVRSWHGIDLPEILWNGALTLWNVFPNETFQFMTKDTKEEKKFNFYPAQLIDKIPKKHFDIILNISSFEEMDKLVRDRYIHNVQDWARRPTLFINVNRRRWMDESGKIIDNHPLFYPYNSEEVVLDWSVDRIQETVRTNCASALFQKYPKSFAIIRIGLLP